MDARLQRRVQRYGWDKAAASYESYWQRQLAPAQDRLLDRAALQPGERVIEVAAGTGLVTFRAATLVGPTGSVTATDISETMVARLSAEAARRRAANVTAMRMDAEALNVPEASFDAAICALGLMYVPDAVAAMAAMRRALRQDGRAVVAVWGARSRCGWAEIFPIVDSRVQSDVCPLFFQLGTGDRLKAVLEEAGFEDVSSGRIPSVLRYESPEDACGAAFEGGPVALAYSRFDEATRAAARVEYLASIESWRNGRAYDVPGEFVVARGERRHGP